MDPHFLDQVDIAFVPPHWGDRKQDLRGLIGHQGEAYLFGNFHFSYRHPEGKQIVRVKNLLRLVPAGGTWTIDPEFRPRCMNQHGSKSAIDEQNEHSLIVARSLALPWILPSPSPQQWLQSLHEYHSTGPVHSFVSRRLVR